MPPCRLSKLRVGGGSVNREQQSQGSLAERYPEQHSLGKNDLAIFDCCDQGHQVLVVGRVVEGLRLVVVAAHGHVPNDAVLRVRKLTRTACSVDGYVGLNEDARDCGGLLSATTFV